MRCLLTANSCPDEQLSGGLLPSLYLGQPFCYTLFILGDINTRHLERQKSKTGRQWICELQAIAKYPRSPT